MQHSSLNPQAQSSPAYPTSDPWRIFLAFLRMGLTSFGGPVAHLGYFRDEFVRRRSWLSEHDYADVVALAQFLPGPASSQVGVVIGLYRGSGLGALAAWLGFTLPSAVALVLFGLGMTQMGVPLRQGWLHGLKLVALAVVAQAIWGMGKGLCRTAATALIAAGAAVAVLLLPTAAGQITTIVAGACFGYWLCRSEPTEPREVAKTPLGRRTGVLLLVVYGLFLFGLPVCAAAPGSGLWLFERFYRTGALVFGGGHVVLPVLQTQVLSSGILSEDLFLAGYGAAQAVPGPLFTFAAYIGAVAKTDLSGWGGAATCLVAMFLPGMLLICGVLPFWQQLRRAQAMQAALKGINASVVGILMAAFCGPIWGSTVHGIADIAFALVALMLLLSGRVPTWSVVLCGALLGMLAN